MSLCRSTKRLGGSSVRDTLQSRIQFSRPFPSIRWVPGPLAGSEGVSEMIKRVSAFWKRCYLVGKRHTELHEEPGCQTDGERSHWEHSAWKRRGMERARGTVSGRSSFPGLGDRGNDHLSLHPSMNQASCWAFYLYCFFHLNPHSDTARKPTLSQTGKPRVSEVPYLAGGHTAGK